jgi:hypothetical protein
VIISSKLVGIHALFASAMCLFTMSDEMARSEGFQREENSGVSQHISVVIRTDQAKYSLSDSVKLDVSLENIGDNPAYVDRRMYWGGLTGGLKVEISDEQGKPVPSPILQDAPISSPKPEDTSILVRLNNRFFYGTRLDVQVKDWFPKPGRYAMRVVYKSWLQKDAVPPQLRNLPAIWADTPPIRSAPVWIDVSQ